MRKDIIGICIYRHIKENCWSCGVTFGYVQNGKTVITGQVREGIDIDIVTRKKPCFTYTQLKNFMSKKHGIALPSKKDLICNFSMNNIEVYAVKEYSCILYN